VELRIKLYPNQPTNQPKKVNYDDKEDEDGKQDVSLGSSMTVTH
jgi:hypothetical protein